MQWIVHSQRFVYESPWLALALADIEIPGHRVEWLPVSELRRMLRAGEIIDGMSVTGLSYFLAMSPSAS